MAWVPKTGAPAYFSLADAFLALITGDPDWGWLVDWLTLVPNAGFETAGFCAQGPVFAEQLILTDFIPSWNPLDPKRALNTAGLAVRISAAARDRVFGAYCELEGEAAGGADDWTEWQCYQVSHVGNGGDFRVISDVPIPAGSTPSKIQVQMVTAPTGGAPTALSLWHGSSTNWGLDIIGTTVGIVELGLPWTLISWSFDIHGTGTADFCIRFNYPAATGPTDHTPTEQPQPEGVVSPLRTVDPTLEGIALELERVEYKLDTVWPLVQAVAGATLDLGGPVGDADELVADTPLDLGDAVGVIITASGVPEELAMGFGVPQEVARLGRINFGTATAWYPMVPLTHVPMVFRPLPPGTTRISVTGVPPGVTMTIAPILPLK